MGCNIEPLAEYITSQNKNNVVIWAFDKVVFENFRKKVHRSVKVGSFAYYRALFCCKYVLANQRMTEYHYPIKRQGQVYLQTWHGTALKRIEKDIPNVDEKYQKRAERDSSMIDLFISGSKFMSDIYRKSFWYIGEVVETGMPRNDIFFKDVSLTKKKVCSALNIATDAKILLYAPTFRQSKDSFLSYDIDSVLFLKSLTKKFGGEWTLLVRMHPNLISADNMEKIRTMYPGAVNASTYPDMQELLCATDVLLTDYSSSMFDFMYTRKPCFLYIKDYKDYDRGFYLDVKKLPFPVIESNSQISMLVNGFDAEDYANKLDIFMHEIGSIECGKASKRCYDLLVARA